MAASDSAFLADVEDFLATCGQTTSLLPLNVHTPRSLLPKPSANETNSITASNRARRASYYERQRMYRDNLRREVIALTDELIRTRKSKRPRKLSHGNNTLGEWMAQHHLQLRKAAEAERRQLQGAISFYSSFIQKLQETIQQCNTQDQTRLEESTHLQDKGLYAVTPTDTAMFTDFQLEVSAAYSQTDDVLKVFATGDQRKRPHGWERDGESFSFRYTSEQEAPIDISQICRSMWYLASLPHRQENRIAFVSLEDPENSTLLRFRIPVSLSSGQSASILQRVVLRRFEETQRTVFVLRSFAEGEGCFAGMHADETGWCVVTQRPGNKSLVQSFLRHVPMHLKRVATDTAATELFARAVLETGTEDAAQLTNMLENSLVISAT